MRSAFTLVEVVAAAAIASIAGIALLQMNSQGTFMFSRLKDRSAVSEVLSRLGNHADKRFSNKEKTLYDILDSSFTIENDELRKYLQNEKYVYHELVVDVITLDDSGMEEEDEMITDQELENAAVAPMIQFELIQVTIKKERAHGAVVLARPF